MKKADILNAGFVELLDCMGDDMAVVNAARVSYLGESEGNEKDRKLLEYLMAHDHQTPFEMVVFKFRVKAPELVFRQWVRHRIGSFSVQSRRYTEVEEGEFYEPDIWRPEAGREITEDTSALSQELALHYDSCLLKYQAAIERGVAREQARLFLPGFAVYSTFIWCVNVRSLMNFLRLRLDPSAQWEIQQYARAVWNIFEARLPWTAAAYVRRVFEDADRAFNREIIAQLREMEEEEENE